MRKIICVLLTITILHGLWSCNEDVEYLYSRYHARFVYRNVLNTIPLRNALNNLGTYCTIQSKNNEYVFTDNAGNTQSVPKSYIEGLTKPVFIAGLIVGYPSTTNIKGQYARVAYDLACPNCYETTSIVRALSINANHMATCGRCHCVYDLDTGDINDGDTDIRRLITYQYITYFDNSNDLSVTN
ncbi:MAG: hypothetical protein IJT13_04765 [Bacteroidaceae bacterium]|nr:hypothetical protein [Bacteroidaceae bacterium]